MAFYHTACFVFTVMIVCNAILYPTIFSSMFRRWFGGPPPKPEKEPMPEYPPHMRAGPGRSGAGRMRPPGGAGGKPPMPGSSGGVDPSNFMGQQGQDSKGRGMMGTVLPVYAVGIFIYFGYVIYKVFIPDKPSTPSSGPTWNYQEASLQDGPILQRQQKEEFQWQLAAELKAANYFELRKFHCEKVFLRDKPSTPSSRPTWNYQDASQQDGPTLQREQQEKLQRKLAAELKAANYPELKKSDKRAAELAAAAATVAAMGEAPQTSDGGSNEEVDMLKRRLEETEKTMQRMMDMMNSMGVAMSQVSQHLSTDKTLPPDFGQPNLTNEDENELDIDVDNLSDEEDLIIGDSMDQCQSSSEDENDVAANDMDIDRPNKMNIVDVEAAHDYHDEDDDDDDIDSDDESEDDNMGVENITTSDTLRRRNVKGVES